MWLHTDWPFLLSILIMAYPPCRLVSPVIAIRLPLKEALSILPFTLQVHCTSFVSFQLEAGTGVIFPIVFAERNRSTGLTVWGFQDCQYSGIDSSVPRAVNGSHT